MSIWSREIRSGSVRCAASVYCRWTYFKSILSPKGRTLFRVPNRTYSLLELAFAIVTEKKTCTWSLSEEWVIQSNFKKVASSPLSCMLSKALRKGRPGWLGSDYWDNRIVYWASPWFQKKRAQAKASRNSKIGRLLHTCGSVSREASLTRAATREEVWKKTHKKIRDENEVWVETQTEDTYEEMQLDYTSIDTLEISDSINIPFLLEAFNDSNTEVADMVKSYLDSKLPVLSVEDTIPQCAFIDATELKFSHVSLSVKGPLEFNCKVLDSVPKMVFQQNFIVLVHLLARFHLFCALTIASGWILVNAPKLFDKMAERSRWLSMLHASEHLGEVEVLIECSDNLTSFCDSYKLLGISLENSFLYSLDRFATSRVERYEIDQFKHVRANCRRDISVERCKIGNFTRQMNLELVISQPAQILEWIDSLKGWMSLSPQQEQVEGILMLVGQIEGFSDYNYDSCMVYVPNGKFLSSIGPTVVKYWERYTGPVLVKEWRKHLDIILPMYVTSIQVTYGAYIVDEGPTVCIDEDDIGSDGNEGRGLDKDLNGNESDVPSTDSDVEIPDEDGSDIDEELRAFRAENRSKKKKKNDRYVGRLGGDEEFIDISDCDSIDSTDLVYEDVVVGADLRRRRRTSKIRFDDIVVLLFLYLG
ncbi:hypothetical protein FXO38_32139 [Capsicum annuum]|nr:hypothetical protein FXO38_32139 [Capsicum annuum]